jgi:hypothetical protein
MTNDRWRSVSVQAPQAPRKIAVAGATGKVGRHVVDVLTERGCDVVAMSRTTGVDVATGDGLAGALGGVECVIDAASGPTDQQGATGFFTAAARNLHTAGRRAGVRRMVVISTIGCDRFTAGYMAARFAHEQAMLAGPIPVRVLRAEIFHEMVAQFIEWGRQGEVSRVMKGRARLVAARTVAETLADLALAPDRAAPGSAEPLAAQRGDPVRIEGVTDPSDPDSDLVESGALLHGPDAVIAGPSFQQWLATAPTGPRAGWNARLQPWGGSQVVG